MVGGSSRVSWVCKRSASSLQPRLSLTVSSVARPSSALLTIARIRQTLTEFNTDDRFYYGSSLGQGFIESTTAWALNVVVVGALILVGVVGLREDDYERIAD